MAWPPVSLSLALIKPCAPEAPILGLLDQAFEVLVPHQATFARLTIRRRRGSLVWRFRQAM